MMLKFLKKKNKNKDKKNVNKSGLKNILSYLGKYKIKVFFVIIFAIASTCFTIVGPNILGDITTEIFEGILDKIGGGSGIDFSFITTTAIILIGIYVLSMIFSIIQGIIMSYVSNDISFNLREAINKKINNLPMKYFDSKNKGEVLSIIVNDVDTLTGALNQSITTVITGLVSLVGISIMMFSIDVSMSLVSLAIIPISLLLLKLIIKKSQKYFREQQDYLGHVNSHVEEIYGGYEVVKAFTAEKKVVKEFRELNNTLYESAWKSQFYSSVMHPLMQLVGNLGYVIVSIYGGYLTVQSKIQVGDILSFTQYIRLFTQQLSQLSQVLSSVQSAIAASSRINEFLELEEEVNCLVKKPLSIKNIKGAIEFKNVSFGYSLDKEVISNFSVKVKQGQKIAIVGPTGAGKTTIVKLLMRFYELNSGKILVDGKDITRFDRNDIRSQFGMVLQDSWLFNGTIFDNVRYSKLNATNEEIINACKTANVDHFVKSLPDGYNTIINEAGDNISVGQKQLLTIARAILLDPKILILDEATSNVDTRTEVLIQKAMDKLMKGRTSFIIAHRLSTIKNADMILVMNDGGIVEQGNHNNLLKKKGFYANLYNSQFGEDN